MTTFSQLVDEMVAETKRPDLKVEIANYVNQTIREVHFEPQRNNVVHYRANLREDRLIADIEQGFSWLIPNMALFQGLVAVKLSSLWQRHGQQVWSVERPPSRAQNDLLNFHYQSGDRFFFYGYGGIGGVIDIAWYEYPMRLKYLEPAQRPATWDDSLGWSYSPAANTPELQLAARTLTSNWLLLRWHDVLAEGVRAKVYKRTSDDVRMRTSFANYQQLRQGLYTSEIAELGGAT